jgi:KTSC domain
MKRTKVDSTSLSSVGYTADTSTLEVEFLHGACYRYFAVPRHTFEALMTAHSLGAFLNAHIKGRYPFQRVAT